MKILLSLIIMVTLANASYKKAQAFYEKKEYRQAIQEAKSTPSEYANPKLHLVWAKSAQALGDTKAAMSAYERVVMLDAQDTDAKMALLKIYKESSRDTLAKELRDELQNYQLTPEQRSALELLKSENIQTIKAKATLGLGYDSNINVSARDDQLNNHFGVNTFEGEKGTLFAQFNGGVSYINDLKEKGSWYIQGDANVHYQNNFDASYYNLLMGGISAGVGYAGKGYSIYLPVSYDRMYYLEQDLLGKLSITPKVNISLSEKFIVSLSGKYALRKYQDTKYIGMDDTILGGGVGLYYLFERNFAYINFAYDNYSADETPHFSFINKDMATLSLGVNFDVNEWLVARADYRYRDGAYDDSIDAQNTTNEPKRSDGYYHYKLKLSHCFKKHYELFAYGKYAKNNSNYIPAVYEKKIFMFGISANY